MYNPLFPYRQGRATPARREDQSDDPFSRFQNDMNRLFDEAFSGFGLPGFGAREFEGVRSPQIELNETDEALEIEAELPGVAEDDLDVRLTEDVLTIRGEKRIERKEGARRAQSGKKEEDDGNGFTQSAYASFARSIRLPFSVEPDKVDATFKNGCLKLTLPKPDEEAQRSKKIAIKHG